MFVIKLRFLKKLQQFTQMKNFSNFATLSPFRTRSYTSVFCAPILLAASMQYASAAENNNGSYYVERKSYGTSLETEPPKYVKQLNKTWLKDVNGFEDVSWLDIGLDHRIRYEHRDNDFRRAKDVIDDPILLRTRAYVGIKDILDPLRFAVELGDARRNHSQFSREYDTRDVNQGEVVQAYLELFFKETPLGKDELGNNRPISIKVGRQALEQGDKRLVARNGYRNTTNNFEGVRAIIGQQSNDWQLETFAFKPVQRFTVQADEDNDAQHFYGALGNWRRWSQVINLQPYYYLLKQDGDKVKYDLNGRDETSATRRIDRTIHTAGLRAYGVLGKTGWDYDTNYVKQWGEQDTSLTNKTKIDHDAYAYNAELGYTFDQSWKPRLSGFYGVATGDKSSTDKKNQRFERLFGFARPWSNSDTMEMSNIRATKLRVEFDPKVSFIKNLKIDAGYNWYRLESDTDSWGPATLRDTKGLSGSDIGEEFDITARFPINSQIYTSIGYAHFMAGNFTKNATQIASNKNDPTRRDDSDYLYVQFEISAF